MIEFRRESFEAGLAEGRSLAERDYEEMIPYKHAVPHEVDEERYIMLERAGSLRCFSARKDGRLIGYCIYVVTPGGLHSRNTKRAECVDWWLLPEERKGWTGVRMIRCAEDDLIEDGVVIAGMNVMAKSEAARVILPRLGYELAGYTYVKVLQNG